MTRLMIASLAAICVARCGAVHAVTIPTVPVGNPGNPADTRYDATGFGSVAYNYRIGTTEVTNAQYTAFLNAVAATDTYGLYYTSMASSQLGGIVRSGTSGSFTYDVKAPALSGSYTYDDKPVVYVSWGDAVRFANWLHNGQPTGAQDASTTEDGAYTLNGAVSDAALNAVTRNSGARWWLPSEDEWYKAAYHKNDGVTGNYWDYPTGTNSVPNNNLPANDTGNSANFWDDNFTTGNSNFPMTDAGAYLDSYSAYGTFDQGGNVWEWNETLIFGSFRGFRGASVSNPSDDLHASSRGIDSPTVEFNDVGFRVASIPEPATTCLGMLGIVTMLLWRRGRR